MIETRNNGTLYTLCLDCANIEDPIPCPNKSSEPCDACGEEPREVTYLDYLPRKRGAPKDSATIAARAIIRGMDRPRAKIPRR